jgi:hypothetical protein
MGRQRCGIEDTVTAISFLEEEAAMFFFNKVPA